MYLILVGASYLIPLYTSIATRMTDDTVPGNVVIEDIYFDEVY